MARGGANNFLLQRAGQPATNPQLSAGRAVLQSNGTLRAVVHCPFLGWVGFEVLYSAVSSPILIPAVPFSAALPVTWSRASRLMPSPSAADSVDVAYTGLSGNRATLVVGVPCRRQRELDARAGRPGDVLLGRARRDGSNT
jgi:hypothetical protein